MYIDPRFLQGNLLSYVLNVLTIILVFTGIFYINIILGFVPALLLAGSYVLLKVVVDIYQYMLSVSQYSREDYPEEDE